MKNILSKIPDKPSIPLQNYLMDLVDKSDGKESSLYLNNVERIFQALWSKIVQKNWRKLNVIKFAPEKLGVSVSTIYSYKWGKKGIPIQRFYTLIDLWQILCGKSQTNAKKKWDEVFNSNFTLSVAGKSAKVTLPKSITPKLSYLIGWICGDGHLYDRGNHYLIKISEKSINQLSLVLRPLFQKLFGIKPPVFQRYQGGHALQVGSKPIYRFLTKVLKVNVGRIPYFIEKTDTVNKKYFLCGIFDAEGHINPTYLDSRVVISQANLEFLQEISSLSKDLGLRFNNPQLHTTKLGRWYTISIRRKAEILKFAKDLGSFHIDKSRKLKRLVKRINENWHR